MKKMKKMVLILVAVLLVSLMGAAGAESPDALYRIVLRTESGDVPLGTGVVFGTADTLLTAADCLREGECVAIGADGEHAVSAWEALENTGAALLHLADSTNAVPVSLTANASSAQHVIHGVTAQGVTVTAAFTLPQTSIYHGRENLVVSTMDGLLPGAVVLDSEGALVALTVRQQAEGKGLYTALYAGNIRYAQSEVSSAFIPVDITWVDGKIHLTWTDEERTTGLYHLCVMGEENDFYTVLRVDPDWRDATLSLAPGHRYQFLLQWLPDREQDIVFDWNSLQTFAVPEVSFSYPGFTQTCALVIAPQGQELTQRLTPPSQYTLQALSSEAYSRHLQIICTHEATEKTRLLMTYWLTAPDGQFYSDNIIFTFDPEDAGYEQVFALPVDELLTDCAEFSGNGTLPLGEYSLSWSLAGRLAGRCAFTLTEAEATEADIPADDASAVLVENLRVTAADGFIHVDWSDCAVPEEKTVITFLLYENNAYYSYTVTDSTEGETRFVGIPGARCAIWAVAAEDRDAFLTPTTSTQSVTLTLPEAQPITLNGLTNLRCAVTVCADPNADQNGEYLPVLPVTREALERGDSLFFQTEDTYTVAEAAEGYALNVVLTMPDGTRLASPGEYSFLPEYSASDLWVMDITDLADGYTTMLDGAPWPAGVYTVGYYIGGQAVAELTFTLE